MSSSAEFLYPSEAARRLGVSPKALRLYEQRGLVRPVRTEAGWRAYGPVQMAQAREVAALRALGLSLSQVSRALNGEAQDLEPALAAHQAALEGQTRRLGELIEKVRAARGRLTRGERPSASELTALLGEGSGVAFGLPWPWPWGGERFELRDICALNYIIGPLGSGKTRLARQIAEALPDAAFLDLDRKAPLVADEGLAARVEEALRWLVEDGATASDALSVLVAHLEARSPAVLVVDMVEQDLDEPTQEALIARLRRRGPGARPLFLMTRSSAILDLAAIGPDEVIILCPANHSPPSRVTPHPGAPGYEAVATCLASPAVRARTEGLIAVVAASG
ncbi:MULTISPECIES: MerR family transcriptional regulator [Phenylobacterium]|uniref:DNA-binding transcriptional MerR regulator n=1 Tax=Phenylobacterium koreense TaxID=266125 RepID=A0ABV2EIK1_9CAUL